jgi:Fe-S oxidoreductase
MPGKEHKAFGQAFVHEAPKVFRSKGGHEAPRYILENIPGLKLVEMERIKEYTWCCGAGGGVLEAYPDFALWTANERLEEARATGAKALVTCCPWCERSFKDALAMNGDKSFKIYNIVELMQQAI